MAGCNVCANVNRHLHGAGQVQGDDVLEVKVVAELVGIKRLFGVDAQEAASKRLELLIDHLLIHACLLSFRIRVW